MKRLSVFLLVLTIAVPQTLLGLGGSLGGPSLGCRADLDATRRMKVSFHYEISKTGSPSTSIFGSQPRPGFVDAASRPFSRCGAPSAKETVT